MTGVSMRTTTNDVVHRETGEEPPIGNTAIDGTQMKPVKPDDRPPDYPSQRPQVQKLVDPNPLPQSVSVQEPPNVQKAKRAGGARRTRTRTGVSMRTTTNDVAHQETSWGESQIGNTAIDGTQMKPVEPDDEPPDVPLQRPQVQKLADSNAEPNSLPQSAPVQEAS
eukprot:CAMPEP_0171913626 /NCGR_PEP_ID=MMETSP0993-20121228/11834_1 /TAXON_ID=483369 /ORGANISM="non described non described, Strain CCMP2098" /LENGTH=165 /DNA_ID=CAMNT_0012547635 /DNA_START=32 /DNA_END=526 /DNA_ORIENTATION=+